jgi:hypothetical protein
MLRLQIFGHGLVRLSDEKGAIVQEMIVPDPEKAQEVVMDYLKNKKKNCICSPNGGSCRCTG